MYAAAPMLIPGKRIGEQSETIGSQIAGCGVACRRSRTGPFRSPRIGGRLRAADRSRSGWAVRRRDRLARAMAATAASCHLAQRLWRNHKGRADDGRAAHLQSVSDPGRVDRGLDGAAAAHRRDGVQRGLRQPVSLSRLLRQPLRGQGLLPAEPALSRHGARLRRRAAARLYQGGRRAHGLRVIMDLVVNHTAKDSELAARRPQWFARDASGEIQSPFAVDPDDPEKKTVWGDLAELDYRPPQRDEIVAYFEELVRHYVGLGFRGFRCDAAYKVPAEVWRRLVDAAKACDPDVVFCAENLGASEEEVLALAGAGFDYLFNSLKWWDFESPWLLDQYEKFRHIAPSIAFPESHDTERLVTELLAAGFPGGPDRGALPPGLCAVGRVLDRRDDADGVRIRLVAAHLGRAERPRGRDRSRSASTCSAFIAAVNRMKASVPALNEEGPQRRLSPPDDPLLVLLRQTESGAERALILVNTQERETRDVVAAGAAVGGRAGPDRGPAGARRRAGRAARRSRCRRGSASRRSMCASCTRAPRPVRQVPIAPCPDVGRDPGHRPEWRPDARILIEDVWPEIDAGRYPIKRVVGDEVTVWADIFRDGHDKIRAVLKYALRGRGLAGDAVRVLRQRPLDRRASGRTGSGAGAIRSRPGPTISKAGATIWSRSRRPGRTSRSNSSRASGSSRRRSRHADGADAARLRAIAEEFDDGRYGGPGRADAVRRIARADGARRPPGRRGALSARAGARRRPGRGAVRCVVRDVPAQPGHRSRPGARPSTT